MTRKLITYTILIFGVLLLGSGIAFGAETSSVKLEHRTKTIYIDPWYGGKEKGPLFGSKKYGKDITLEVAQKIQNLLESVGFQVYLSRNEDKFVTLEDRLLQGKSRGASVHLAIKVSQTTKDCARIYVASPPIKKSQATSKTVKREELDSELKRIINDLITDDIIEESLFIGKTIADKLRHGPASNCSELWKGKDYILKNALLPTVMVDFRISSTATRPFVIDEAVLDKIAELLADSIKEYSDMRTQKSNN